MAKISNWSVQRRVESLRQMDLMLMRMGIASRETVWHEYGGGLEATAEKTHEKWKRIAESDELYNDALFCYMICTLEEITLEGFHDAKGLV